MREGLRRAASVLEQAEGVRSSAESRVRNEAERGLRHVPGVQGKGARHRVSLHRARQVQAGRRQARVRRLASREPSGASGRTRLADRALSEGREDRHGEMPERAQGPRMVHVEGAKDDRGVKQAEGPEGSVGPVEQGDLKGVE